MRNKLFASNGVFNMDKVEAIYEQDGKTVLQFPGGNFHFETSFSDFWKSYTDNLASTEDETQKELARVTRDYEELVKENDRLKEMVGQLFTANGRLVYANMLKERRKGPRRWR